MSIPSASVLVKDVVNLLHEKGEKYSGKAASDEINGLVSELSLLQKIVEEIDKEQRIHDWLTEVEKTCYDVENIMVETQNKNADFLFLGTIKRWFFSDVDDDFPRQISLLRKRIRHLLEVGELLSQDQQNNRPPLPSGLLQKKDSVAVGLFNELDFLLNRILESKSDSFSPNIISVVGIGGLGKTTLVSSAQRDFDQLWGALGSIIEQLVPAANEMLRNCSIMGITVNIRSLLASAKCLVVIHDLWSLDYLDWLSSCLGIRETTSKLVATTRFQELATSNPSIELFKLRHLTEEESLELLVHRVCVNIPEVKDVVNLLHEKGEKYSGKAASDEINGLVSELSLLQKLVEEIDKEQRIHDWLTEVEKTCYDVEDIVVENQNKIADFLSLRTIKRWFFSDVDDDFPGQISLLRKRIRHLLGVGKLLSQGQQNNRPPLPFGSL
nr:disease resistance protein RPP13-like [Coffea arabica]